MKNYAVSKILHVLSKHKLLHSWQELANYLQQWLPKLFSLQLSCPICWILSDVYVAGFVRILQLPWLVFAASQRAIAHCSKTTCLKTKRNYLFTVRTFHIEISKSECLTSENNYFQLSVCMHHWWKKNLIWLSSNHFKCWTFHESDFFHFVYSHDIAFCEAGLLQTARDLPKAILHSFWLNQQFNQDDAFLKPVFCPWCHICFLEGPWICGISLLLFLSLGMLAHEIELVLKKTYKTVLWVNGYSREEGIRIWSPLTLVQVTLVRIAVPCNRLLCFSLLADLAEAERNFLSFQRRPLEMWKPGDGVFPGSHMYACVHNHSMDHTLILCMNCQRIS